VSLKRQTLSGVAWSSTGRVGQQVIQFALTILLARLLLPEDFGLIGMVLVFTGFASLFAEFGFSSALIQRPEITEAHSSSVFWLNLLVGLLLSGGFYFLAPLLSDFYAVPDLQPVARALAITFSIASVGIVPTALLQRRMDFKRLARLELLAAALAGGIAVFMALRGFGVWALVAQTLIGSLVTVVLAFILSGWRPSLSFSHRAVADLLHFSSHLFGFKFINYWARNADNLLVGKLIGSVGLGIYSRAYSLMLLPVTQVIRVISRVMFPALSLIQDDTKRVKRVYLRAMGMIALITFPMMTGLFVVAEPFVLAVLGVQWSAVVPVLQILCVVGLIQALCNPTGWIYQSQGRTDWLFWWGVGGAGTLIVAISIGAALGTVESVAWAYMIANLVLFYPCIMIPGKLIGMHVSDVVREVSGALVCSCAMAGLVWTLGLLLPESWSHGARLTLQVITGAAVYFLVLLVTRPAGYRELEGFLVEWRQRRVAVAEVGGHSAS
jgi:O-antigen/teichoic acid export membrane protein